MLRFISGLAFSLVIILPAHAAEVGELSSNCSAEPSGPLPIDGMTATEEQMKSLRAEVQAFVNAAQEYISCVSLYSDSAAKKLSQQDTKRLAKIIDQVADEKEEVGCGFQKELDVYNRKHGLKPVDFDQVCVERFARQGIGPAPKTP
jgi:hypothetical protein